MNDFENRLKSKLPGLFHTGVEGEPVVPCGCYCPVGWETIVEDVLTAIDQHVRLCSKSEKDNVTFYKWYKRLWVPIYNYFFSAFTSAECTVLERVFPKLRKPKKHSFTIVTKEEIEAEKLTLPYKLREKLRKFDKWIKGERHEYKSVPVPPVKIEQIKEKFGGLRIYINGGDTEIQGMISFAEFLCSKTCMFTGQPGERGNIGGWIVTATKEELEKRKKEREH